MTQNNEEVKSCSVSAHQPYHIERRKGTGVQEVYLRLVGQHLKSSGLQLVYQELLVRRALIALMS
jgi:hypothetical protein